MLTAVSPSMNSVPDVNVQEPGKKSPSPTRSISGGDSKSPISPLSIMNPEQQLTPEKSLDSSASSSGGSGRKSTAQKRKLRQCRRRNNAEDGKVEWDNLEVRKKFDNNPDQNNKENCSPKNKFANEDLKVNSRGEKSKLNLPISPPERYETKKGNGECEKMDVEDDLFCDDALPPELLLADPGKKFADDSSVKRVPICEPVKFVSQKECIEFEITKTVEKKKGFESPVFKVPTERSGSCKGYQRSYETFSRRIENWNSPSSRKSVENSSSPKSGLIENRRRKSIQDNGENQDCEISSTSASPSTSKSGSRLNSNRSPFSDLKNYGKKLKTPSPRPSVNAGKNLNLTYNASQGMSTEPELSGFCNRGVECYRNSILQLLYGCRSFIKDVILLSDLLKIEEPDEIAKIDEYERRKNIKTVENKHEMIPTYQGFFTFAKVMEAKDEGFVSKDLESVVTQFFDSFDLKFSVFKTNQQDAHEFLIHLMDLLIGNLGHFVTKQKSPCPVKSNFGFEIEKTFECSKCKMITVNTSTDMMLKLTAEFQISSDSFLSPRERIPCLSDLLKKSFKSKCQKVCQNCKLIYQQEKLKSRITLSESRRDMSFSGPPVEMSGKVSKPSPDQISEIRDLSLDNMKKSEMVESEVVDNKEGLLQGNMGVSEKSENSEAYDLDHEVTDKITVLPKYLTIVVPRTKYEKNELTKKMDPIRIPKHLSLSDLVQKEEKLLEKFPISGLTKLHQGLTLYEEVGKVKSKVSFSLPRPHSPILDAGDEDNNFTTEHAPSYANVHLKSCAIDTESLFEPDSDDSDYDDELDNPNYTKRNKIEEKPKNNSPIQEKSNNNNEKGSISGLEVGRLLQETPMNLSKNNLALMSEEDQIAEAIRLSLMEDVTKHTNVVEKSEPSFGSPKDLNLARRKSFKNRVTIPSPEDAENAHYKKTWSSLGDAETKSFRGLLDQEKEDIENQMIMATMAESATLLANISADREKIKHKENPVWKEPENIFPVKLDEVKGMLSEKELEPLKSLQSVYVREKKLLNNIPLDQDMGPEFENFTSMSTDEKLVPGQNKLNALAEIAEKCRNDSLAWKPETNKNDMTEHAMEIVNAVMPKDDVDDGIGLMDDEMSIEIKDDNGNSEEVEMNRPCGPTPPAKLSDDEADDNEGIPDLESPNIDRRHSQQQLPLKVVDDRFEFTNEDVYDKEYNSKEESEREHEYILTGVVMHLGNLSKQGHYIAYVYSLRKKKWYSYNDTTVLRASIRRHMKQLSTNGYLILYTHKSMFFERDG